MSAPAPEATLPTVLVDDERVRVTRWSFAPAAATGWHRHELDYVAVPIAEGTLRIDAGGGETSLVALRPGDAYSREAWVEHDVINARPGPFAFVEIEIKTPPPASPADPGRDRGCARPRTADRARRAQEARGTPRARSAR